MSKFPIVPRAASKWDVSRTGRPRELIKVGDSRAGTFCLFPACPPSSHGSGRYRPKAQQPSWELWRRVPLPCGHELLTSGIFTLSSLGNEKWLKVRLGTFPCVHCLLRFNFVHLSLWSFCKSSAFIEGIVPSRVRCLTAILPNVSWVCGVFKPNKLPHFYCMASECCIFMLFPLRSC